MKSLVNFVKSLGGPVFWLLVIVMSVAAVWLLLVAFSIVKMPKLKWY